jgi:hypothetical protein
MQWCGVWKRSGRLQRRVWTNWRSKPWSRSRARTHYSGQAVDEILSFERTEGVQSLLFVVEQAIQEKVKSSGPLKMTRSFATLHDGLPRRL